MTACWWDLCIVLVCFWGYQQDKWNIGGRNWKSKCANLNCQDAELFAFIRKSNFSLFNKAKRRKERCHPLFFFFSGKLQLRASCEFLLPGCFRLVITKYEGGCGSCCPFQIHPTQMEYSTCQLQCTEWRTSHSVPQGSFPSQATLHKGWDGARQNLFPLPSSCILMEICGSAREN